jgi:hypothetical protein
MSMVKLQLCVIYGSGFKLFFIGVGLKDGSGFKRSRKIGVGLNVPILSEWV